MAVLATMAVGSDDVPSQSPIPTNLRALRFNLLKPRGKEAIEKDWPDKANYPYDDPKLIAHISKGGNYGVLAKPEAVIIETDTAEFAERVRKNLPPSFTDRSPGHHCPHFYYKLLDPNHELRTMPLFIESNGSKLNVGHIKCGNSYVVGPHCTHPNGQTYQIVDERPLAQVTASQVLEVIAPYIARKSHEAEKELAKHHATVLEFDITKIVDLNQLHRQGGEYFGAHPVHGSETGRNFHINPETNEWFCFRCMSGGGPFQLLAVLQQVITCEQTAELRGEKFKQVLQVARERDLVPKDMSLDTDPFEMAEFVLAEMHLKTFKDTKEVLLYQEGVYVKGGEAYIARWIEEKLRDKQLAKKATINFVREVTEHVKRLTYEDRLMFDADSFILNMKNGLLNVDTEEFREHTPDYLSVVQMPVKYDPTADCPKFHKFRKEVMYQEDQDLIQETFGSTLWKDYPTKKATLLVGDGNNGKTTLIEVLKAMLGTQNVAARNLQELETNRFAKADLYGKLANLYADLSDAALKFVGVFKMLTGGDLITAEHKFQTSFSFINFAKLIFSCNTVPEVYEDTRAFFDRWNMVTFPSTFVDSDSVDTGQKIKRANKNLKNELKTEHELSGVLNWSIAGLKRLRANGWVFSGSRTAEEIRDEYIRKSSPIHAFVLDCLTQKPDARTPKKVLFQAFCDYCNQHHLPIPTSNTFFQRLPEFARVETQHPEIDGKRVWCVAGIELKPPDQWGEKTVQVGLNGKSGTLDGEKPVHPVPPVHGKRAPKGTVHDVQHVQASGHLSSHSDILVTEEHRQLLLKLARVLENSSQLTPEVLKHDIISLDGSATEWFDATWESLAKDGTFRKDPKGIWRSVK
jgi:putative DNA primase/helicase